MHSQKKTTHQNTMLELFVPHLPHVPQGLRAWLEPVLAAGAFVVLLSLVVTAATNLLCLSLVGALIYAILTKLFGIQLELDNFKPN